MVYDTNLREKTFYHSCLDCVPSFQNLKKKLLGWLQFLSTKIYNEIKYYYVLLL